MIKLLRLAGLLLVAASLLVACTEPPVRPETTPPVAADPLTAALQRLASNLQLAAPAVKKPRLLLEPVALGLTGEILLEQEQFIGPLRSALNNYTWLTYQPEQVDNAEWLLSVFIIPATQNPDTEVELYALLYEPKEGTIRAQSRIAILLNQVPLKLLQASRLPIYPDTTALGELWRSVERNRQMPNYYLRSLRLRAQLYLAQRHFERGELTQAAEIWTTFHDNIDLLVKDKTLARQTQLAATLGLYQIALKKQQSALAENYLAKAFKRLTESHQPVLARFPFKPGSAEWLPDPESQAQRRLLASAIQQLLTADKGGRLTVISHVSKSSSEASSLSQARARAVSDLISASNKRLKGRIQTAWKGSNESLSLSRHPQLNGVDDRVELIWLKVR